MRLKGWAGTQRQTKQLRREMSLPEVLLWRELRKREVRWRKGHPAGPYTLDFYCAPALLAVEVDGEAHGRDDRPERDAVRDAWLEERKVRVLRIAAPDILRDLDAVLRFILAESASRRSPSTSFAGPPPPP
ncbi:endonuclease domain-containing protein [Sphingomonas lenta]|uniref:DUF559 domain-containing protein n=1 Tax=Sphingomonas lenta TaxID=1141887 RepID=A0A2A2SB78_9SPHN|nr:endonuclease domain-containing protein [Sphingomonas lenta]PAX06507.1 hypothetical protein CKY28_17315 [Sphingomonas lenta]